ncbi:MAG: four helix bundle protein [Candidatus Zambryskibacteria bacterium CG22_combo_CG10-13_8_21_14_all_42_17]|uniref:Four helix bundle protein n=1 Tax=Candidatus Zambryskibacteria bacterium CG22_combo_CG10-13_8_21_14_all_42_17 TaxID=1975118 RepID=A0A2H0BD57_9BACT|nr:MAG: four helix bundle protein [Candidatus Zambryskibacteria bacterium CG22_combo_CG10-13_8_21_14_all_42_17]
MNTIDKKDSKYYDLTDRTFKFSQDLLRFCRKIRQNHVTKPLISQLIRSGTSIGANYCEADSSNSKKDFINKISISKKEANETKYWIRLLAEEFPEEKEETTRLFREAQELHLIFSAIIRKSVNKISVSPD